MADESVPKVATPPGLHALPRRGSKAATALAALGDQLRSVDAQPILLGENDHGDHLKEGYATMIEVGQEVTVINDKGIAYNGYVMATATSDDGQKAYKISVDGGGLQQLGQWHKGCDVFIPDPPSTPRTEAPIYTTQSFLRH